MPDAWWLLAKLAVFSGMTWWLAVSILIPMLFPEPKKQAPLEAPAPHGPMPAESTTFAGYYRRFRALGLNPVEAARETLIYKLAGR